MTDKTSLGDRMKKYESAYDNAFPIRLPLIIRLDGVHFSTQVKKWKCEKPFDQKFIDAMHFTALTLCEQIAGAQIAYTQSDEITILIRDDMSINSQPWYAKEINKILSVSSAKASNAFNHKFFGLGGSIIMERSDEDDNICDPIRLAEMAEFDCRGYVLPEEEIFNAFLWRQRDFEKNSVQMLARSLFSHSQLEGKGNSTMQDMMMSEHKVNWNDLPTHLKRGACVLKKDVLKEVPKRNEKGKVIKDEFETINRPAWVVDKEIPIFTQDRDYVNQFTKVALEA